MATIRLRIAESKAEMTRPPAFLIIFASPFFRPNAAGSSSVSRVSMHDNTANFFSGYLSVIYFS